MFRYRIIKQDYEDKAFKETCHIERGDSALDALKTYIAYCGLSKPPSFHKFKNPYRTCKSWGFYTKKGIISIIKLKG